jgi:hypothetical protein
MTVEWLLMGSLHGDAGDRVGSIGSRPLFQRALSEAVIPLSANLGCL